MQTFIMEKFTGFSSMIFGVLLAFNGCGKSEDNTAGCDNQITLNQRFTAKIGETWCLPSENWEITFNGTVEDSRCNVPEIDCVWAGRYVLATTIDGGSAIRDTFNAVNAWRDTLYQGNHTIILDKVYPELRPTMDPLNESAYAFDIIVR
jgi:hypothetical protein